MSDYMRFYMRLGNAVFIAFVLVSIAGLLQVSGLYPALDWLLIVVQVVAGF